MTRAAERYTFVGLTVCVAAFAVNFVQAPSALRLVGIAGAAVGMCGFAYLLFRPAEAARRTRDSQR